MLGLTSCERVSVRYRNGDWGLREATVEFAAGVSTAVVGPSGSGKSTLLNTLCGLAPVVSGRVRVDGAEVFPAAPEALARLRRTRIGVVFQQGLLLGELSCVDNVALPLRLQGVRRGVARVRALELLDRLDLGDCAAKPPWRLSGGQRQRVAVARAVVHSPALVLADEPTGSLDRENSERTIGLLLDSAAAIGATLVVVTHDDAVASRCSAVVRVVDGSVAAVPA
ncbi:MAG TPA: ABC transporter ATP-binding protein [Mycobacteriales bacterium]